MNSGAIASGVILVFILVICDTLQTLWMTGDDGRGRTVPYQASVGVAALFVIRRRWAWPANGAVHTSF